MKLRHILLALLLAVRPAYAGIESYSAIASSNNSSPPNGAPEGMAPSAVNNVMRQMMADTRTWYEDAEWISLGHTHTYASGTSFTVASTDITGEYTVGRRIRAVGSSTGTIYGTITASSFSTNTTVTVEWDSGSLSNESLTVSIAAQTTATQPYIYRESAAVASASSVNLDAINGDFVHVTGATAITGFTLAQGQRRVLVFDGALTLTHNGTSLILPTAANIATAAGDVAVVVGEGSNNVRVVSYTRASGQPLVDKQGQFKVGSVARDLTTATGTQAVTGLGFSPSAVVFITGVNGTAQQSWGFSDGTSDLNFRNNAGGVADATEASSYVAFIETSVSNFQLAELDSLDADGFTLAWTKGGSPTGTAIVLYMAYR